MNLGTDIVLIWPGSRHVTLAVKLDRAVTANELRLVADVVDGIEVFRDELLVTTEVAS